MEKKTSSVEYLVKEISEILGKIQTTPMQDLLLIDAIKQAKKMQEQQIKEAYNQGYRDAEIDCFHVSAHDISTYGNAQQYYNETFKG